MTPEWLSCLPDVVLAMERSWPDEGCGLILRCGEQFRFLHCRNLAPPEDASSRFEIDPLEWLRAADRGEQVAVIVHSHVDAPPVFSDADHRSALAHGTTEPLFPDVDYLIVSTTSRIAAQARLYRHSGQPGFVEMWRLDLTEVA